MTLMGTFTQWEWKAAREREYQLDARQSRLARELWVAAQTGQPEQKSRSSIRLLEQLACALAYMAE